MSFLDNFMNQFGEQFSIIRNGVTISTVVGLRNVEKNSGKKCIHFYPDTDIMPNDWVIALSTSEEFFITEIEFEMGIETHSKPASKDAYYQIKHQYETQKSTQSKSVTFNINNAHGSVIGTDNYAPINNTYTIDNLKKLVAENNTPDKEKLDQLINMLELLTSEKLTPSKGILNKFSEVMEKNSWITGAVSSTILSWLFNS